MDFLKSAVASAIAKGPPFPYTWGDRVDLDQSIWTMHNGTRRVGTPSLLLCLAISWAAWLTALLGRRLKL